MMGVLIGTSFFDFKRWSMTALYPDLELAEMDAFALGLKIADKVRQDGRLDEFVKERYSSYRSGIGQKIAIGTATLEELEAYVLEKGDVAEPNSGKQEYLESIVNHVMFAGL